MSGSIGKSEQRQRDGKAKRSGIHERKRAQANGLTVVIDVLERGL
jgi:hypothetical protein